MSQLCGGTKFKHKQTMKPFFYLLFFCLFLSNIDALSTTCSTCATCNTALNDNNYEQVNLTANIINQSGICIDIGMYAQNKTFDCDGHTIEGDNMEQSGNWGLRISETENTTVKNCIIKNFKYGIYLYFDINNISIVNNTVCKNSKWDILNTDYYNIFGDNNTCARVNKFRDNGYPLCSVMCSQEDPNYWWFLLILGPTAYWYYFHRRKKNNK